MTTLQTHNYVGPPTDDFEEMCVPTQLFLLEGWVTLADIAFPCRVIASQQPPQSQASIALSQKMSQRGLDPKQSFRSSLQQYVRRSCSCCNSSFSRHRH